MTIKGLLLKADPGPGRAAGPHEPWQGQSGDSERRPVHAQLVCGALRRRADCA